MMRRVCKRPVQIDALTLCFEVVDTNYFDQLTNLDFGEWLDIDELRLYRIEGKYFENVYAIRLWNGTRNVEWGHLKFNIARGDEHSNTHINGLHKVWMSLNNETLYGSNIRFLTDISHRLGLVFHNVTTLDLCLDTPFNVSRLIKTYAHNKDVVTILNGKCVTDRSKDRPELRYVTSGSLDRQSKYLSVSIKQKNAIKDKGKGITVLLYDKLAEINNASGKQYILEHYGKPKRLYRTEVHLNAEDIKNYVERRGLDYTLMMLFDEAILEDMFFHFLENVIRFRSNKMDVSWKHILGRS